MSERASPSMLEQLFDKRVVLPNAFDSCGSARSAFSGLRCVLVL
jgi:hypothetical protein